MSQSRRLADLEKNLELLYEKQSAMQRSYIMAADAEIKISIKQRIREEIAPKIRETEAEYWQVLAQEANPFTIDEADASRIIVEVVQTVAQIEQSNANCYPNEVIQRLTEIQNKLNDPGKPAAAKAKLALPLVPGIISYEVELDTENALRWAFQPLRELFKKAQEKEKK